MSDEKAGIRVDTKDAVPKIVRDEDLKRAVGASSDDFLTPFISQLVNAGSKGTKPDPAGINFMLSVVKGIEPRDQIEAMLGAQMAAVHMAAMTFARRLNHVDNITQQDSAERAFNKLTRTFTTQIEALKRYRSSGEQRMRIEHVHVHAGGQAIVGQVGDRSEGKDAKQPDAKQLAYAPGVEMPSTIKAEWVPVPSSGCEGK